jgi:Mrp family chromosome partitioning ATPase
VGDVYKAMMRSSQGSLLADPDSQTDHVAATNYQWQPVAENALHLKVSHEGKIADQFEEVRIKLMQNAAEHRVQIHAFASAMPGPEEGRASCALHLALSFARMPGTRVLLIDMDASSHGALVKCFDGQADQGLADFVGGEVTSLDAVTYPTDVAGLHLMPLGKAAMGSTLFDQSRLGQMLDRCRDLYDHIVIDAPAVLGHSGCTRLGKLCDEMLLAVALRFTPTNELERAKRLLADHGCQVTGVVLTERK